MGCSISINQCGVTRCLLSITNRDVCHAIRKPLLILHKTCPKYFGFLVTFILCLSFNIQIRQINTFLVNSQPEECSSYDLKILVNLSLNGPINDSYRRNKRTNEILQFIRCLGIAEVSIKTGFFFSHLQYALRAVVVHMTLCNSLDYYFLVTVYNILKEKSIHRYMSSKHCNPRWFQFKFKNPNLILRATRVSVLIRHAYVMRRMYIY